MRKCEFHIGALVVLAAGLSFLPGMASAQTPYNISYTSGGTWSTVYVQGFNTSLGASPVPAANVGDQVNLSEFDFYKSGTADSAANIQLAIFSSMYPNTVGLSTSTSGFIGLSTNTILSTAPIATGSPEQFFFNNLPLAYGTDYGALLVNVGAGGSLTPVLVSALTANYQLESDSNYHPVPNYGTDSQYNYATSNYISGGYFQAFNYAGDANFNASLTTVPEPASLGIVCACSLLLGARRRAR
jgi:hypothetical protein